MIEAPDGTASSQVYLIQYNEDQWFRYDDEGHKFCYGVWLKKAKDAGCRRAVLRLIPDPIFPRGSPKPYVYWQEDIVQEERTGFRVSAHVMVFLDPEIQELDVPLRNRIERALCEYPNGTPYEVKRLVPYNGTSFTDVILSGKVNK